MASTFANYPANYLRYNQELSKNLVIVMEIEGVPDLFGVAATFTQVRYGDPNIVYGLPGLVYGGLRGLPNLKSYIVLDNSFVIQQRIEPEQGKGNVGTLTVTLIDYNGEMSKIVSPGIVIPEIIFNPQIRIWIGFAQTSFPEDFVLLYSGYCTTVTCPPGIVQLEISDATSKTRQPLYNTAITYLTSDIDNTTTTIPVQSTGGFYRAIQDIHGNYDSKVNTYIMIDSEIMQYDPVTGFNGTNFLSVIRGVLGTSADNHSSTTEVDNSIYFGQSVTDGGIHFIDFCLKTMLSGWDGPCESNVLIGSFVFLPASLSTNTSSFSLASQDAIRDLGLSIGDQFTITGATNSGNNISGFITGFQDGVITNQTILTDQIFIYEMTTAAQGAFRSQYDTFPIEAGLQMRMKDVDVRTWQLVKKNYFSSGIYTIAIYYSAATMGINAIQTDVLLPMGCYGVSRFGRCSISVTKPPLPGITKLVNLDYTNVINPQNIQVVRSSNSRTFYNLISYEYNLDVPSGNFTAIQYFLDTASLNEFNGQVSQLPIVAPGFRSELGGALCASLRGGALLNRYKKCAIQINLTVNWSAGSTIEVSDIVQLTDDGHLQIMNFDTGERNLGIALFEVINRQYNVVAGNVDLTLLGGLGFSVDSRFALISPSSIVNVGSTRTSIRLIPSYGQPDIAAEMLKWVPRYNGQIITIHNSDYTITFDVILISQDPTDPTALLISGITIPAQAGWIVDIPSYPPGTNKNEQSRYKLLYTHISPSVPITSGVSSTQFFVSVGDVNQYFVVGNTVIVRNAVREGIAFVVSQEVKVTAADLSTGEITVASALLNQQVTPTPTPFTPDNTYTVEGIGFFDGQSFYRYG